MNTFYLFEGNLFETEEEAENFAKDYLVRKIDKVKTGKSFDIFAKDFDECRLAGNSIMDSLEWAMEI